ncbi:MAG: efflux RND transporter permease subunit [Gemmatimonadaceae bacterium]|nr:efflux RND transporter permease subunit [Gemmatimonadaceae bacterium]MCW5827203.1 efflux RND transporter permease subunit [Gemmatimonadaceae bacterium]
MIRWAVSRPAVVWAVAVGIVLGGGVSFTRLALATRTTVELPRLQITATWQGASAELVEMYISSPVEAAAQGVRGVRRTSSESRDGSSRLTIELDPKANVQLTRLAILERLELLRGDFPLGATQPVVGNLVPEALQEPPLLRVLLNGPYTAGALQRIANEVMTPRLSAVSGVSGVSVGGGTEFGASVSYDPLLLRQVGVEPQALANAVREARVVSALGTERMGASRREVVLRDQPGALQELEDLPIRGRGGRVFRLGELAQVRPEEDSRGMFYRVNGNNALSLTVAREAGSDAIKTARAVRAALRTMTPELPPGVRWRVTADESVELDRQLKDLIRRGAIAFVAVALVLIIALRNWRAVALVMGSAAIAIAGTALGLFLLEIPANMLTLAGLGMGIGVLVQNGLVVVERLRSAPDTPEGRANVAQRMMPAVVGATLTTTVVLFPFLYLQGNARAAFFPFAAAFTLGLAWSVVSALVMIPALAAGHGMKETHWPRLQRVYGWTVKKALRWRWVTIVLTTGAIVGLGWVFVKKIPRFAFGGFGTQRNSVSVNISFPRGSDPASLDAAMREMERVVVGREGVEEVIANSYSVSGAGMRVSFTPAAEVTAIPLEVQEALTARAVYIGGASIYVSGQGPAFSSGGGMGSSSNFRIRVLGYSYAAVAELAEDIRARLENIARVRNPIVTSGSFFGGDRAFAVTLDPDRDALARYGVTAAAFTQAVGREVRGPVGGQRLEIGGEEIPVTVKAVGSRERSLDELRDALVPTATGTPARIADLSRVDEREQLAVVTREDQRYLRVVAYEFRGPNRLAQRTHEAFMASISVPPGFTVEDQQLFQNRGDESQKGLWLVFAIGVTLVILAVAMVFDSAWGAAMVFISLPIALAGVVASFWWADAAFTREAAVGVILVVGLAVNQSILLVDAALERRRKSGGRLRASQVYHAALDRSGMILMVTLTTLASLVPLAVGTKSTTLFGAIALATAGGTLAGTLGAMLILPAMLARLRGGARGGPRRRGRWREWRVWGVLAFWRWRRAGVVDAT